MGNKGKKGKRNRRILPSRKNFLEVSKSVISGLMVGVLLLVYIDIFNADSSSNEMRIGLFIFAGLVFGIVFLLAYLFDYMEKGSDS